MYSSLIRFVSVNESFICFCSLLASNKSAFVYQLGKKPDMQKINLVKSAIADVKGVVKENNSLRTLAEILYQEGDVERANNYMKKTESKLITPKKICYFHSSFRLSTWQKAGYAKDKFGEKCYC